MKNTQCRGIIDMNESNGWALSYCRDWFLRIAKKSTAFPFLL